MRINDAGDIATHFGLDRGVGWHTVEKAVFKGTECGAWITCETGPKGYSCMVGSIVEGSDADCTPVRLYFPFQSRELEAALDQIEDEALTIWEELNSECPTDGPDRRGTE